MRRFQNYIALFLLIVSTGFYSVPSMAEYYYWYFSDNPNIKAPSPVEVCSSAPAPSGFTFAGTVNIVNESSGWCMYTNSNTGAGPYGLKSVHRNGDSCPEGHTYNSHNGACEAPQPDQCESTVGNITYREFRFATIGDDGNPSVDPPTSTCVGGCQYSHDFGNFTSKRDFGPPDQMVGSFKYKGNGISCSESPTDSVFDGPPSQAPVTEAPKYDTNNECSGWETQPDGSLKRNCTATNKFEDKGEVECKEGSIQQFKTNCTPSKTKPPQKSETKVEQETTKKENADGSSETTTKTDTTKTNCKGMNPCNSTSKSETDSEKTDADGNTTKKGDCVGDDCNPSKPDGDGMGDEEGEQGEERTATVGTCDGGFSCTGDPIDCAILKQQKEQQCYAEEMGDFDGKKSDIEGLFQGENFTLPEAEISAPSIIGGATRFLPAGCPTPERAQLSGGSLSFNYQPLCTLAVDLSWIIVAVASIWAAAYVGRAFGGE
ncbi:virulence factor TspB C-terminal domain-related protein [Ectopseudomonas chengduensis]